jgi:CheY-like chemotaxis protein
VLLAEDNPLNSQLTQIMLEHLGCSVVPVFDGEQAAQVWRQQPCDIILMDCQMPKLDGFGATRLIRESEQNGQRIPIIALTAQAMEGDREQCLAAGMDDYLSKPVSKTQLQAMLEKWLLPKA